MLFFMINNYPTLKKALTKIKIKYIIKKSISASFKGSLSLEASLVIPIFLFALMTMILNIEIIRLQTNIFEAIHQGEAISFDLKNTSNYENIFFNYLDNKQFPYLCTKNNKEGIQLYDHSTIDLDGYINLGAKYKIKPFIYMFPIEDVSFTDEVTGHSFTGYVLTDNHKMINDDNDFVYITKTGIKYHLSENCSYIKVNLISVSGDKIGELRNKEGEKYIPCHACKPTLSEILYITEYGNKYHGLRSCKAINKNVMVISKKEALSNGYTACSKCG